MRNYVKPLMVVFRVEFEESVATGSNGKEVDFGGSDNTGLPSIDEETDNYNWDLKI